MQDFHSFFATVVKILSTAAIAQLGERKTEDLKVPGSIPGLGIFPLPRSLLGDNLAAMVSDVEGIRWENNERGHINELP